MQNIKSFGIAVMQLCVLFLPNCSKVSASEQSISTPSWERRCVNEHRDDLSDQVFISLKENKFEVLEKTFAYNDCQGAVIEILNSGEFKTEEVSGVTHITYNNFRTRLRTMNSTTTDFSNKRRECGFSDWVTGEFKDVSSTQCMQKGLLGNRQYDIIRFDGARLYVGTVPLGVHWDKVGRTPELRPTEFDPIPFEKK